MGIRNWWSRVWRGSRGTAMQRREMDIGDLVKIRDAALQMIAKSILPHDQVRSGQRQRRVSNSYSATTVITDGLLASATVYACMSLIARTVGSVPWVVTEDREPVDASTHPLSRLIASPNAEWSWNQLQQHKAYSQLLWGEAFEPKIRSRALGDSAIYGSTRKGTDGGLPAELWILKPYNVDPVRGDDNLIGHFYDRVNKKKIDPADMIHSQLVHPNKFERGLAPLEPTQKDVDVDVAAAEWQQTSLENRAVPDGVWKPKGFLNDDEWEQLIEQMKEAFAGSSNARKAIVLGHDLEWVAQAHNMVEMDFMKGRAFTAEKICTGLGVPPEMIGARESKFRNYETAERVFWQQTVLPMVYANRDLYNMRLAPEFGSGVLMHPDLSGVDALLRLFGERWDIGEKMIAKGVPMAVVNESMGLGLPEYPGMRFDSHTLEVMDRLLNRGMPMQDVSDLLDLGISPYPGWDIGMVPAGMMPIDILIGGGMLDAE